MLEEISGAYLGELKSQEAAEEARAAREAIETLIKPFRDGSDAAMTVRKPLRIRKPD